MESMFIVTLEMPVIIIDTDREILIYTKDKAILSVRMSEN